MYLETQHFTRERWNETGSKQGKQPAQRHESREARHTLQEEQGSGLAKHTQEKKGHDM